MNPSMMHSELPPPKIARRPEETGAAPPVVRCRILVAEDDPALRYLLVASLRADAYEVVEVANGVDLLDALGGSLMPDWGAPPFDLVLSDVRMPGWSGLDALASLGHDFTLPPFALITAFADDELRSRALAAGAVAVLDKPIDLDDLRLFVRQFLQRRGD